MPSHPQYAYDRSVVGQWAPPGLPLYERLDWYSSPEPNSGCVLFCGQVNGKGYGILSVQERNGPRMQRAAHRAAWERHNGPIPRSLQVLHRCDVRCCVNPAHLFLGTHDDNMADMVAKGRQGASAALTSAQVLAIRSDTRRLGPIASDYGVTISCIDAIRWRRTWKHL